MKTYTKNVSNCKECPNIGYYHFDGEGESADYQFNYPYCTAVLDIKPHIPNVQLPTTYRDLKHENWKNDIPSWCPL